jgi:hypothetical protein
MEDDNEAFQTAPATPVTAGMPDVEGCDGLMLLADLVNQQHMSSSKATMGAFVPAAPAAMFYQ